jgi:hypothetical protein
VAIPEAIPVETREAIPVVIPEAVIPEVITVAAVAWS